MITAEQIKAARALLNWKQTTLAEKAGVSLPSINNIERAIGSPRTNTLEAIKGALENGGIEFISGRGVCLKDEIFDMYKFEGDDFIKKQYDDLLSCMHGPEDEIVFCNINERKYPEYVPEQMLRYAEYQKKTNFTEKLLVRKDDTYFLTNPQFYRWIEPELMGTIPYYVYKDRFVMVMWEQRRTIMIRNQSIADTFRRQFDFLWNMAKPVPARSVNKLDDPGFIDSLDK